MLEQSGLSGKINSYEKGIHTNLLKIFDKEGIDLSGGKSSDLPWQGLCIKMGKLLFWTNLQRHLMRWQRQNVS